MVPRSRHIWYASERAYAEPSNRATEQVFPSLPQSARPLPFLCYIAVWVSVAPLKPPSLPRVRKNEQRRSANENRKSNEDEGAVVSRKLDVLQPTEHWNLKHPTNTEVLNPAKKHITRKKKNLQPSDGWSTFFFSHTNIDKAVYSQAARTLCVHCSENPNSTLYGLLSVIPLIFTVLSWNSTVWNIRKSPLFIYKDLSSKVLKIHFMWDWFPQV